MDKIEEFVPRFYRMNPAEDKVLPNGLVLKNGMRVLLECYANRAADLPPGDLSSVAGEKWNWDVRRLNRWCTVTELQIDPAPTDGHSCHGRSVRFVGVYDDGEELMRANSWRDAWLVKRDSIPPTDGSWWDWNKRLGGPGPIEPWEIRQERIEKTREKLEDSMREFEDRKKKPTEEILHENGMISDEELEAMRTIKQSSFAEVKAFEELAGEEVVIGPKLAEEMEERIGEYKKRKPEIVVAETDTPDYEAMKTTERDALGTD